MSTDQGHGARLQLPVRGVHGRGNAARSGRQPETIVTALSHWYSRIEGARALRVIRSSLVDQLEHRSLAATAADGEPERTARTARSGPRPDGEAPLGDRERHTPWK